jgi:hypothetical protein
VPLVRRADSLLAVVDAQPGFFGYDGLSEDDARQAAGAVTRITWMAGLAALLDIPAVVVEEGPERNGHTDPRILHTVDRALETFPEAAALGTPPWRL